MQNLKTWYLKQPQDVRFGIPVILGMLIFCPIVWRLLTAPPSCEQAKARTQQIERRGSDGSAAQFNEATQAFVDEMKACK
jgi:hypothetical protein